MNTINAILQFLTGVIFFWLGILYWGTGEVMERNMLLFVIGLTVFMTIIVNIGQLIHIRKVDKDSVSNIKGYAWRSFVISIVVSIGIVHLIIMTTIFYVLK
ncbi:hypothetical protein [Ornithinibacillus halophilus]|uniref:Uncharacterized protein n=1 Tax=Ornithinibacillus halophilus TaxID=930117 RepID=A0A1M5NTK7_9BACI|nr:hypothetical protein [Ornithinibacillus halophilus]SHG92944.1 hypothetical protein SAMN05216225_10897 [Ornithinibacillus halophilus]